MNGAQTLIQTLVDCGVDICFSNPGTSEMHFVAALDSVPEMRGILGLFEGGVTGAADGYGRMADKPAATLLHLGPGLANGLANLHNAMRAHTPIVNIIGDHATYHKKYDAPLESDVEGYARNVSDWMRTSQSSEALAADTADAVAAAYGPPGRIASLILPADVSWGEAKGPAAPKAPQAAAAVDGATVDSIAKLLKGGELCALLLDGPVLREAGLMAGARCAGAGGAKFLAATFPARLERGPGLPAIERLAYLAEMTIEQLKGVKHLILVGAKAPVSFFAYPNLPGYLVPDGCQVHTLATLEDDCVGALENLAEALGAPQAAPQLQEASRPQLGAGELNGASIAQSLGAMLPEGAIVSDEGNTAGFLCPMMTGGSSRHDWLTLTGGAIGQGIPVATGAALACPDRKVINLEADGSAMYTLQALWTQARENLDVTTVVFCNRAYGILNMELDRVGATAGGPKAKAMLDLTNPELNFTSLARGMGLQADRATTAEEFNKLFESAMAQRGPRVIECMLT